MASEPSASGETWEGGTHTATLRGSAYAWYLGCDAKEAQEPDIKLSKYHPKPGVVALLQLAHPVERHIASH